MATILVIEDDARIQKALHRLFAAEGYEVRSATDGTPSRGSIPAVPRF